MSMYQGNRNLFSFLAVLITAGLITGMGGLFLYLADHLGGASQVASEEKEPAQTLSLPSATPSLAVSDSMLSDSLATASDAALETLSSDNSVVTVPASAAKTVGTHSAAVLSVSVAENASTENVFTVASGSYDNTVKLWTVADTAIDSVASVRSLSHDGAVNDLVFTADGTHLITGTDAGNIHIWDLASDSSLITISAESGRVNAVAIDGEAGAIAAASSSGGLKIWSLNAELLPSAEPIVLSKSGPQINSLVFHPSDSNLLISGNQKGVVQVWNIETGDSVLTLKGSSEQIVSVDVSGDGQYIATGSYDQTVRVWTVETGDLIQSIQAHESVVANVAFGAKSALLASGSYDESIKLWDWAKEQLLCNLNGSAGFVYDMAFADGGNTLVSGGYDGTVESWDLTTNDACLTL